MLLSNEFKLSILGHFLSSLTITFREERSRRDREPREAKRRRDQEPREEREEREPRVRILLFDSLAKLRFNMGQFIKLFSPPSGLRKVICPALIYQIY